MKIVQVSDLHFVPPGTRLLGLDPRARLEACIADINARHGDAALCVVTGDLADRGAPAAYAALRETLAALRPPLRLLIGNHDNRAAFRAAFPQAPIDADGFVQSVVRCERGDLVLLDTHEPGSGGGSFCARRQAWLAARLAEAGERPVYLFLHHPPFDIGIPSLDRIRLADPAGLIRVLDGAPRRPAHMFFGHVHRPVSGCWRGIPFAALRATVHQVPLDFAQETPVPYSHEPPGYNVILLDETRTVVHHHDFLDDSRVPPGRARYEKAH